MNDVPRIPLELADGVRALFVGKSFHNSVGVVGLGPHVPGQAVASIIFIGAQTLLKQCKWETCQNQANRDIKQIPSGFTLIEPKAGLAATSNQTTTKGITMSYFAGKRILITGAGSGLGRRMALSMAREGEPLSDGISAPRPWKRF